MIENALHGAQGRDGVLIVGDEVFSATNREHVLGRELTPGAWAGATGSVTPANTQ